MPAVLLHFCQQTFRVSPFKKGREANVNIDRSFDTTEMQNEIQERKDTDTLSPVELLTLALEQPGERQTSENASSRQIDEQTNVQPEPALHQPSSPLEAKPSTLTTLLVQRVSAPNTAAKRWHAPQSAPRPSESAEAADLAARRLRLLALQHELAQLKRTPSMQLLARQRIPRLEEAIKCLIASLAESA